jgi:hypothetical protein
MAGMHALLADALLLLHVGVVLFVVGGQLLVLVGGPLGWGWVRRRSFRFTHLALMGFIVLQTWLGQLCPLTVWEQNLRRAAGQQAYGESFIEYWLSRLIFFEAPWWVFVAAYTGFFALVLASWWRWPPRSRSSSTKASRQ